MCIVKWQSAESTWTGGWNHLHINIALQIKATVHPRRQIRASLRKSSDVRNRRITRNGHRRLAISTSDPRSDRGIISRNTKHHPMQPCYSHRCNRSERNAFNEGCNRQITFPPLKFRIFPVFIPSGHVCLRWFSSLVVMALSLPPEFRIHVAERDAVR